MNILSNFRDANRRCKYLLVIKERENISGNIIFLISHRAIIESIFFFALMLAASNGLAIDCQYVTLNLENITPSNYSCLASVTLDGNSDITTVTGTHVTGKSNSDVFFFSFQSANMLRIYKLPSNIAAVFPNLIGLSWTGSRLETISAADLIQFPNLVTLTLYNNWIRKIDGDLFRYNPQLRYLNLGYNIIDYIGEGIFNGLAALQRAYFMNNPCIGIGIANIQGEVTQSYSAADMEADLEHLCGPLDLFSIFGVCSSKCMPQFDIIEEKASAIEARITAPWYEKLKWFFKTAFGLS